MRLKRMILQDLLKSMRQRYMRLQIKSCRCAGLQSGCRSGAFRARPFYARSLYIKGQEPIGEEKQVLVTIVENHVIGIVAWSFLYASI